MDGQPVSLDQCGSPLIFAGMTICLLLDITVENILRSSTCLPLASRKPICQTVFDMKNK